MLPLLALGSDNDQPMFGVAPFPEDEMEKLLADGSGIIIEAVPAIYDFWQERRA